MRTKRQMPIKAGLALALCLALAALASPARAGDVLTQYSVLDALLDGVYDGQGSLDVAGGAHHIGLGTFNALDGEMIVLDGVVYQALADGSVVSPPRQTASPFFAVAEYDPDLVQVLEAAGSLEELKAAMDRELPSFNLFYAVRLDATFESVSFRSIPPQQPPYRPLAQVVAEEQQVHHAGPVEGTLVGLRCPPFSKGAGVPGWHWHFLSADRAMGGHLLDCSFAEATAGVDIIHRFDLLLPDGSDYLEADLSSDREAQTRQVESRNRPGQ